ncbi:EAL domain-containing protein [Cohnella sp. GCM10020058]|uniref:EAL domain-containing protein n=1 Tax=Cohnella sp. GCM10020058 TaxID=3317330 RepID=UPI00362A200C
MDRLRPRYQPIKDTTDNFCLGYEATVHMIQGNADVSAKDLFDRAIQRGNGAFEELDRAARRVAIQEADLFLAKSELLFLNVSSLEALEEEFDSYLLNNLQHRLVFEITENVTIDQQAVRLIESLANKGVIFAIDDFGKGLANWKSFVELPVSYLKMDMFFVQRLNKLKARHAIGKMVEICQENNIRLVLEGIETKDQYDQLQSMGVRYMQGYYLGRPAGLDENHQHGRVRA